MPLSLYLSLSACLYVSSSDTLCLSLCRFASLCVSLSLRVSARLSPCMSVCLYVCVSACLPVALVASLLPFFCSKVSLHGCLSVCLSLCLSPVCLSARLSLSMSVRLSSCLFICLSVSPLPTLGKLRLLAPGVQSKMSQTMTMLPHLLTQAASCNHPLLSECKILFNASWQLTEAISFTCITYFAIRIGREPTEGAAGRELSGRGGRNSELALRQIAISYSLNLGELPSSISLSYSGKKGPFKFNFWASFFTVCCHSLFIYIASIYFTQLRSSLIAAAGRQRKVCTEAH